jgi:hypothetical protein
MPRAVLVIAFAIGAAGPAWAQPAAPPPAPYAPEPEPTVREGLSFGVGLTVGSLVADCDDCSETFEAGGVQGHAAWMVGPYFAIVGDLWVMVHAEGFLTVYQNLATAGARLWATPRLWLQGGLGVATAGYRWSGLFADYEDRTASSPGIMVGAGFEVMHTRAFALSVELRYGTGFYSQEVGDDYVIEGHSAGAGVTAEWY